MNLHRIALALLSSLLLALPATGRDTASGAGTTETDWMSIVLEGRKVGHARVERTRTPERVVTRQHMTIELARSGIAIAMSTDEVHEESPGGEALAFSSASRISGLEMRVEGERIEGSRFAVRSGAAGALRESELEWPEGALLGYGLELKMRATDPRPGSRVEGLLFQPMLQDAVRLSNEYLGKATVDLPDLGPTELMEARQTLAFPGGDMITRVWLDENFNTLRMTMDLMGQSLELLACEEACALAPNQPAELLTSSLVAVPRKLEAGELAAPLDVEFRSGLPLSGWPGIDGQRLEALGGDRYRLGTGHEQGDPVAPPAPRDLVATDWLDYETPAVQLLLAGVDRDGSPAERMRALETIVHRHIDAKSLNIGYASAGDAARLREGDCTEHAVLLAALARATGIHARVVNGLAYAEDYGAGPSLVPHAWVAAWTDERWQAYDAALPGRQLRIALHADDGDPWRFYNNLEAFGQMRIDAVIVRDVDRN